MAPRRIRADRLIAGLGVAVLILGAVLLWLVTRGGGLGGGAPSADERARAQLHEYDGAGAVIRYTETGRRRAVCGYVSNSGGDQVDFISRPNRLMHETAAALPSILGQWLRQYRDIAELRMLRLPLLRQCIHVQVLA